MSPDLTQFGPIQGFIVIILLLLVPLLTPYAVASAKKWLGPKTEEIAKTAAEKAQENAVELTNNLSKGYSAAIEREEELREENKTLKEKNTQLTTENQLLKSMIPHHDAEGEAS